MNDWNAAEYERAKRNFIESRRIGHSLVWHMALLFVGTAGAGWLASWLLLLAGLVDMPARYALAFVIAYATLAVAVRAWADHMRYERGSGADWSGIGEIGNFAPIDAEGCAMVFAVLFIGLLVGAVMVFAGADSVLLDVAFEVVFAGAIVRRARRVMIVGDWFGTFLRRTWPSATITGLVLVCIAAWLQRKAPQAHTLLEAIRVLQH